MDGKEIVRRCGLMPKDGGYKVAEMQAICIQLGINPKQKVADLRKSVIAKLQDKVSKTSVDKLSLEKKDISDLSVEELRERTRDKIILSFAGNFGPSHAGHYNMIDAAISKIKPDIVVIRIVNSEENSRHGTPLSHSLETWTRWGQILSLKHGVDMYIKPVYGNLDLLIWNGGAEFIKAFIDVDVWETKMPEEIRKNPLQQKDLSQMSLSFLEKVPRDFKGYYTYNIQREGNLSATAFVKCMQDLEKDCRMYVPDDIEDKQAYIDNIRRKYYAELK